MQEGKAVGGPRDGVKLSAAATWDGRVQQPRQEDSKNPKYYPGHYTWNPLQKTWVWKLSQPEPLGMRMCNRRHGHYFPTPRYGTKCQCGEKIFIRVAATK